MLTCGGLGIVNSNAVLNLAGDLNIGGNFAIAGVVNWTSGYLNAISPSGVVVVSSQGQLNLGQPDFKMLSGRLQNNGTVSCWSTNLNGTSDCEFSNSSLFILHTNLALVSSEGPSYPALLNAGTILAPAGGGTITLTIGWAFTNSATVRAQTNAVLEILPDYSEQVCFADGTVYDGAGVIRFPEMGGISRLEGTQTLNGTIEFAGFGGSGTSLWTGPGRFRWLGGLLHDCTFGPGFQVEVCSNYVYASGLCVNEGTIRWLGGGPCYGLDGVSRLQ
jgi:hypothetical protein